LKEEEIKLRNTNKTLRDDLTAKEKEADEIGTVLRCAFLLVGWLQEEANIAKKEPGSGLSSPRNEIPSEIFPQLTQFYC
jgi:hypothetical protein